MHKFFKGLRKLLDSITYSWTSFLIVLGFCLLMSYLSYKFNAGLPKPETFKELVKFYFTNTGPYLEGTLFNVITASAWFLLGTAMIHDVIQFKEEYPLWFSIIFSILGLVFVLVAFYFFSYFVMLILTLLVIGIIAYFVINALADNKSYR
jgi:hypothetical protein